MPNVRMNLNLDVAMSIPGVAEFWEAKKGHLDPEIVEFLDAYADDEGARRS